MGEYFIGFAVISFTKVLHFILAAKSLNIHNESVHYSRTVKSEGQSYLRMELNPLP